MRFRLLGNDGREIDSRQIRVTRSFMAQSIDPAISGIPTEKTPQSFNLSKEDKGRLDRLSALIRTISDEPTKKELSRYTDQL